MGLGSRIQEDHDMNEVSKVTTKPTGAGAIAGKEILVDGVWKATVVERFVPGCVAAIERELNPAAATPAPLEIGSPTDPDKNPDKVSGSPASPAATPRDCKHGKLARSCDICELERECADLRGKLAEARSQALEDALGMLVSADTLEAGMSQIQRTLFALKEEA